jgi:hypothetical protein
MWQIKRIVAARLISARFLPLSIQGAVSFLPEPAYATGQAVLAGDHVQ